MFVPHKSVAAREAEGWRYAGDLGPVHGYWSVLMEWGGDALPKGDKEKRK